MSAAKDRRLYARLDIGFDEHDKIYPLSDAAFRALVESTLYARRQLTDGFLAERMALKRWGAEVLEELSTNDPERPSLVRVEGGWQIHDFAEHQTTNADIQAKREAGAKGGKAKAERMASKPVAPASEVPEQNGSTHLAKTETETEVNPLSNSGRKANIYPDDFEQWWANYPRREAKGDALKAWKMLKRDGTLPDLDPLIAASKAYAIREQRAQFRKLPGGWLRDHKWSDEKPTDSVDARTATMRDFGVPDNTDKSWSRDWTADDFKDVEKAK